jgi:endoribonuclease Dicer
VAASLLAFPAIISRFECYLVAMEACASLDLEIELALALEALTKDSDNTDEHRNEQIHFQRGMGKNYERLEFLGDCFLKMATSISLFAKHPEDDEYDYHVSRMCLVCNKNLFNVAKHKSLYKYIRTQGFSRFELLGDCS